MPFDPEYGYPPEAYCVTHKGRTICPVDTIAERVEDGADYSTWKFCLRCGRKMSDFGPLQGHRVDGFYVLCEKCWDESSPSERLAYHLAEAKSSNWFNEVERIKRAVLGDSSR